MRGITVETADLTQPERRRVEDLCHRLRNRYGSVSTDHFRRLVRRELD